MGMGLGNPKSGSQGDSATPTPGQRVCEGILFILVEEVSFMINSTYFSKARKFASISVASELRASNLDEILFIAPSIWLGIPNLLMVCAMRSSTVSFSLSSNSISDSIEESVLAPSSSSESSNITAVSLMIGKGSSRKKTYVYVF